MTETSPQGRASRKRRLLLISAVLVVSIFVLWIVIEWRDAHREYAAYGALRELGATGDDWVSFRELFTGRSPIVQIRIPAHIQPELAFSALPNLKNLEALTLAYPSLSTDQLGAIQRLKLESLRFEGSFPRDADVSSLAGLRGLRFLYVPSTNLSAEAQARLKALLYPARIEFD
jgi:hypothetical protein